VLEIKGLSKEYPTPTGPLRVLADINLSLGEGASVSIVGPSGSGKSTLLYILGALEPPSTGTVTLNGRNPFELDDRSLAAFRNGQVGFVFQDHHLLPQCTVLENVLIPTLVARDADGDAQRRALDLLNQVGLGPRMQHRPHELSGGEKQRAAIARAIVNRPEILVADEPTGNLDIFHAWDIIKLLLKINSLGTTVLLATHDYDIVNAVGRRVMSLDDGRVIRDEEKGRYMLSDK
jgi:lipoprotein-releasing system ATP-binding protein